MAIKNFVSNKVSKFTRYSKDIAKYEYLKEQNLELKETAKKVFGTKHILENAKTETFNQAQKRLGLNEMDILEVYRGLCVNFYTYSFITVILLCLLMYFLFFMKILLTSLIVLTITGICLANCFKYSFRAFQLKNRKLCPVSDWYESGEFIPEFPSTNMIMQLKQNEDSLEDNDEDLTQEEKDIIQKEIDERLQKENELFQEKLRKSDENYYLKRKKEKEESLLFLKSLREQIEQDKKGNV